MSQHHALITVLGAGSWGSAVAIHLARAKYPVLLWGRDEHQIQHMHQVRENSKYLPGIPFPPTLSVSSDLEFCLRHSEHVCIAVPSHAFASLCEQLPETISGLCWITKGLDPSSNQLLSQIVAHHWGPELPCAILSGPSFAKEVARGLPTALILASQHAQFQKDWFQLFHHDQMRVYLSSDLVGVQICAAVKNVLAIACGMSDGLKFGANAKAALMTRGLAEMKRLGLAMGGLEATFYGLAGMGDLVLTCTDDQSRNRRFGLLIGQGQATKDAIQSIGQVVEGVGNVAQVLAHAQAFNLQMPICEAVHHVVMGRWTPQEAAQKLIAREPSYSE